MMMVMVMVMVVKGRVAITSLTTPGYDLVRSRMYQATDHHHHHH